MQPHSSAADESTRKCSDSPTTPLDPPRLGIPDDDTLAAHPALQAAADETKRCRTSNAEGWHDYSAKS